MFSPRRPQSDEVEQLLRNAELRDELERYLDESISRVNVQHFSLAAENEFLAFARDQIADNEDFVRRRFGGLAGRKKLRVHSVVHHGHANARRHTIAQDLLHLGADADDHACS